MNPLSSFIFDWLSPQGVMAAGILWTVIQNIIASHRAAKAAKMLANTTAQAHAASVGNGEKLDAVTSTLDKVIEQTNGMSHRLEILAGEAGVARGRAEAEGKKEQT